MISSTYTETSQVIATTGNQRHALQATMNYTTAVAKSVAYYVIAMAVNKYRGEPLFDRSLVTSVTSAVLANVLELSVALGFAFYTTSSERKKRA